MAEVTRTNAEHTARLHTTIDLAGRIAPRPRVTDREDALQRTVALSVAAMIRQGDRTAARRTIRMNADPAWFVLEVLEALAGPTAATEDPATALIRREDAGRDLRRLLA